MAQPDLQSLNSAQGIVLFDDGVEGQITNWITSGGIVHETYQPDAYAIVAKHPGPNIGQPWYAIALGDFEAVIH
jgi:hypothetical protein